MAEREAREVWPHVVEPDKRLQWLTEIHEQEWLEEGAAGVGTHFDVHKEIRGQVRRYDCVIERLEECQLFAFTSEAPGFSYIDGVWELVPEGKGYRSTVRETINVQNVNPLGTGCSCNGERLRRFEAFWPS